MSPKSSSTRTSKSNVTKKRSTASADNDEMPATNPKKIKTNQQKPRKKQKAGRSIPQHRRGTDIQPSEDVVVGAPVEETATVQEKSVNDDAISDGAVQKAVHGFNERSRGRERSVQPPETSLHEDDVAEPQHLQPQSPWMPTMKDQTLNEEATVTQDLRKDGAVVNQIGKPGPRKRKRQKHMNAGQDSQSDAQPQPSHNDVPALQTNTLREPTSQDPVPAEDPHKDGVVVNAIGRPGPARKKSKAKKPAQAKNKKTVTADTQAQKSRAGKDGIKVNPIGRPGPRRKKQKRQHVEPTSQEQDVIEDAPEAAQSAPDQFVHHSGLPADHMLTPPVSPEENYFGPDAVYVPDEDHGSERDPAYDPRDRPGYVDPAPQIADWLDSQHSPAPRDTPSPAHKRPSRKRKRASHDQEDDSDEYRNNDQLETDREPEPTPKSKSTRRKSQQPQKPKVKSVESHTGRTSGAQVQSFDRGTVKGAWSPAEKDLADQVFKDVCQQDRIQDWELKAKMLDWSNVGSFKVEMNDAFPRRTLAAIRKFCQRKYSAYERGPWNAENDEKLKEAYAEYRDKWIDISHLVGRSAPDCRDRWKNHISISDTMERGPWSQDEEAKLIEAVEECLEIVKENCEDEAVRNDVEQLGRMLDWKTVASKMEGKRSTKRCYEKWQQLERRQRRDKAGNVAVVFVPMRWQEGDLSKKAQLVESAYAKFEPGDIHDALTEIYSPMANEPSKEFRLESTFWSIIAKDNPNSRFSGALRRRAYYGALEKCGNKKVKAALGIAAKASWLRKKIKKMAKRGELELTRGYRVDRVLESQVKLSEKTEEEVQNVLGPGEGTRKTKKARTRKSRAQSENARALSEQHVYDSDEEIAVAMAPKTQQQLDDEDEAVAGADEDVDDPEQEHEGEMDVDDERSMSSLNRQYEELPISSINSRYEESERSVTPDLSPMDFLARCAAVGRQQHRQYLRRRR